MKWINFSGLLTVSRSSSLKTVDSWGSAEQFQPYWRNGVITQTNSLLIPGGLPWVERQFEGSAFSNIAWWERREWVINRGRLAALDHHKRWPLRTNSSKMFNAICFSLINSFTYQDPQSASMLVEPTPNKLGINFHGPVFLPCLCFAQLCVLPCLPSTEYWCEGRSRSQLLLIRMPLFIRLLLIAASSCCF